MQTIRYETGRDYGAPQVLEITFPEITCDAFDAAFISADAFFIDAARGISGRVKVFGNDANNASIGRAVLAEYDAGRYQPA
jgi:hypothetical protein